MNHRIHTLVASAIIALAAAAPARATDLSGATASGYVYGDFLIGCTTCSHFLLTMSGDPAPVDGGAGASFASVAYAGTPLPNSVPADYTLAGGATMAAQAGYEGLNATPILRARVFADNAPAFLVADPFVEIGVDRYGVSAMALVVQRYTYTGPGSVTYTFNFRVDGVVSNLQSSVGAYAGFYDDFLEVAYASNGVTINGVGIQNVEVPFDAAFSLSMTFNSGESFYMQARLDALALATYSSADVVANAMDTFRVTSITGGDPSLLVASLVPEPSGWMLVLAGLGVVGSVARRRSRAAQTHSA